MAEWKDEYKVDIPEIDLHHRTLFDYVNRLDQMVSSNDFPREEAAYILQFLGVYAKNHFAYEEACMQERKCPAAQKNQDAHGKFLEAYGGFMQRFQKEGITQDLVRQIHRMASDWLVNHICKIDIQLKTP